MSHPPYPKCHPWSGDKGGTPKDGWVDEERGRGSKKKSNIALSTNGPQDERQLILCASSVQMAASGGVKLVMALMWPQNVQKWRRERQ